MHGNRATIQSSTQPTWTTERLNLLKIHFEAGLSCSQIAAEIGVSRNAVIGKLSRLNLARDKAGNQPLVRKSTAKRPPQGSVPRPRLQLLRALQTVPRPTVDDKPIHNGHCCSLFELSDQRCRWPISTPGAADFCFCGNPPVEGLPYCPGHSRLAYRVTAR
jgi:GcrA cell cycle regulator